MWVTVIATLYLADVCTGRLVTEQATQMQCRGPFALQALSRWMDDEGLSARGYTLKRWDCIDNAVKRTPV